MPKNPNWIDIFPQAVLFVMVLQNPLAFVVRYQELYQITLIMGYFSKVKVI